MGLGIPVTSHFLVNEELSPLLLRITDTSILHHAFISIFIALWAVYFTLCYNTYGYSLLFYKVYMKKENAGSWNSGLEKEQIL